MGLGSWEGLSVPLSYPQTSRLNERSSIDSGDDVPFATAGVDLKLPVAKRDRGSDGWVVKPALRPLVGTLHEGRLWSAAVGDRGCCGEVAAGMGWAEVAVSAGVVVEVPVLTSVDGFAAAAAGGFAGVDDGGDGGAAALVCCAPAATGGCSGWLATSSWHQTTLKRLGYRSHRGLAAYPTGYPASPRSGGGGAVNEDQVEGKAKQVEGEAQESWGDVKEKADDTWEKATRETPGRRKGQARRRRRQGRRDEREARP